MERAIELEREEASSMRPTRQRTQPLKYLFLLTALLILSCVDRDEQRRVEEARYVYQLLSSGRITDQEATGYFWVMNKDKADSMSADLRKRIWKLEHDDNHQSEIDTLKRTYLYMQIARENLKSN